MLIELFYTSTSITARKQERESLVDMKLGGILERQ